MTVAADAVVPSLSGELARHVANTRNSDFDSDVIRGFRRTLVDYLACALAGANMPVTVALRNWAIAEGTRPVATVIGTKTRLSASEAAFVNGASAHALDFDDGQTRGSVHPGGVIFSAALAAAERQNGSFADLIAGVVMGYDVTLRIASAMHPASASLGWHNTPVSGVFGATAAALRIRGANAAQIQHGLGIAASFAGGIRQYVAEGAEVKRLHPGKAARDGLVCAGLAEAGITGAIQCFEGSHGLFRATVRDQADTTRITDDLGAPFLITTAYFKPYPCCRHYHAAIDAALSLRDAENLGSGDVTGIEIGLYEVGARGHDHIAVPNLLAAQMSAPCAIAAALMHGRVGIADLDPAAFSTAEAQRLLAATRVFVDEDCQTAYPGRRSGVVTLTLSDGRRLEKRVMDPKGEGENQMSDADLSGKFLDNGGPVIGPERAQRLLDLLWQADGSTDLAAVIGLLSPKHENGAKT